MGALHNNHRSFESHLIWRSLSYLYAKVVKFSRRDCAEEFRTDSGGYEVNIEYLEIQRLH
jgi:hypothetical protein